MIPRIIHYTWFSTEPMPDLVVKCLASWHRFMPDWQYELWNYDRISSIQNDWLKECLEAKKWAFAADFVRMYAVTHFGGIYLDTDVEVYQSLEPLLSHSSFIGREWYVHTNGNVTSHYLSSHCFGAEPHHPYIERCLAYYQDRHFLLSAQPDLPDHLRFDQTLLPQIQADFAASMYGYDARPSSAGIQVLTGVKTDTSFNSQLIVYPYSYFDCYSQKTHTYCRHHSLGSWYNKPIKKHGEVSFLQRIQYHIGQWFRRFMWRRGYIIYRKQ